jgi:peptidoglycan/LPS O-acetylase OafA/YrhL
MQPTHKYLSNLTPLRGIDAIWVVVFHFQVLIITFILPEQTLLVAKGYLMVDLFFIMSGFIISHVYQQNFQAGIASGNFRRFIVARFARIYPLHLFTLILLIIFIGGAGNWNPIDDPKAILPNIFLLHSFGLNKVFTWNVPSWSISAEWWAYMVFPLLTIFIYRKKTLALTTLGLFVVTAYIAIMFWIPRHDPFNPAAIVPHNLDTTYDYGFLRGLAGFISGMLLYKVYEAGIWNKLFQRDFTALLLIVATIVCMHFGINDGLYIILFIALVYAFALNNRKLHTLCNNRFAQYLGKISYSIYLSSMFVLFPFRFIKLPGVKHLEHSSTADFWTGLGYCLALQCIQIGISSITYYGIELPCRKYINAKWGKQTIPVQQPALQTLNKD